MKLLLDTHFALWLIAEPIRMSPAELHAVETNEIAVSAVSLWEFRLKWQRRRPSGVRKGPIDPDILLRALGERDLHLLALTPDQAATPLDPPLDHADPFDELLLAHAQQTGRRLLTRDRKLASHPVALVP